jgi:hypothetical protein
VVAVGDRIAVFGPVAELAVVGTVGIVRYVVAFVVDLVARVIGATDQIVTVRNRAGLDDAVLHLTTDFDTVAVLPIVAVGVVRVVLATIERFVAPIVGAADLVIAVGHCARLDDAVENIVADLDPVAPLTVVAVGVVGVVLALIHRLITPIVRTGHAVAAVAGRPTRTEPVETGLVDVAIQEVVARCAVGFMVGFAPAD